MAYKDMRCSIDISYVIIPSNLHGTERRDTAKGETGQSTHAEVGHIVSLGEILLKDAIDLVGAKAGGNEGVVLGEAVLGKGGGDGRYQVGIRLGLGKGGVDGLYDGRCLLLRVGEEGTLGHDGLGHAGAALCAAAHLGMRSAGRAGEGGGKVGRVVVGSIGQRREGGGGRDGGSACGTGGNILARLGKDATGSDADGTGGREKHDCCLLDGKEEK